jgi:UDP-N-acetylmuramoyl-tripeptide--D-alanyl-D-alanine ligase
MSKGISGIIKYGTTSEAHLIGKVLKNDPLLEVEIVQGLDEKHIKTNLVGDYNLPNVLGAITVGKYFSVGEKNIKAAIENYNPSNSRSQLIQAGSNTIILDAYNANPSSMKLAIENFAKNSASDKVLMLGAMAELGKESITEHQNIIDIINQFSWKAVVLVGGDFLKAEHSYLKFESSQQAKEWLQQQYFENTYLLVKGSRSMQMEKVLE